MTLGNLFSLVAGGICLLFFIVCKVAGLVNAHHES